jgi:flavin reductase (DIM6/NTAB) family NADH-FMN oxidoreductase RutF
MAHKRMNTHVTIDPSAVTIQADDFREAMRQLSGGVAIITAGIGAERTGMTATSVSSLAIEPPSLVVCVKRQSSTWLALLRFQTFGVSILRAGQESIADRFAGRGGLKGAARFGNEPWLTLATGVPLLAGALAAIDCSVEETIDRHSHSIVIGRVQAVRIGSRGDALVYWRGQYSGLSPRLQRSPGGGVSSRLEFD